MDRPHVLPPNLVFYQAESDELAPLIRRGDHLLVDTADHSPRPGVFLIRTGDRLFARQMESPGDALGRIVQIGRPL